jgi:hypothetical protein
VQTKEHVLEQLSLVDRVLAIDPNDVRALERKARTFVAIVL